MSYDARNLPSTGKPIVTPKAHVRSRGGAYIAPRLATPSPSPSTPLGPKKEQGSASAATPRTAATESFSTPVKNFLSSNITPRSSSRKARVDSASSTPRSTPNGTPTTSRPTSVVATQGPGENAASEIGLGLNLYAGRNPSDSGMANAEGRKSTSPERAGPNRNDRRSPMFFHASDATATAPRRTSQGSAVSRGFVYADGRQEPATKSASNLLANQAPKFFHANSISESAWEATPSNSNSPTSQPFVPHTRPANPANDRQRSTSPLKDFELPAEEAARRRRRSSAFSSLSQQSALRSVASSKANQAIFAKNDPPNNCHYKSQSLSSGPSKCMSDTAISGTPQPARPITNSTTIASPLSLQTHPLPPPLTSPASPLVSPGSQQNAAQSSVDQLNTLAANARRERKVLDLEISNSSLLAINRTLEREMRKQKAELRRYRRLTSSGRLSLAPTDRSVSSSTDFSVLSDIDSEVEDDFDGDNGSEDFGTNETDTSSASSSPNAQANNDARRRVRDERRLRLDLDKHQEILIDSQKLNQSLKRCLGWTEELILEGRKALAYQVRVSDVAIGGRVLHADDEAGSAEVEPRKALLSPTHVYASDVEGMPWGIEGEDLPKQGLVTESDLGAYHERPSNIVELK